MTMAEQLRNGDASDQSGMMKPLQTKNGQYVNPFKTWEGLPKGGTLFKFMRERMCKRRDGIPDEITLKKTLPVIKPSQEEMNNPPSDQLQYIWIGHATLLIQMNGCNILTDPIFSERCSPVSFAGPKRYRPAACSVDELPRIDVVVISHNHYDHLDLQSVHQLNRKYGKNLRWYIPVGLRDWFVSSGGVATDCCTELSWWESATHNTDTDTSVEIVCTPAQHWSMRNPLFDRNKSLWSSWVMKSKKFKVFFSGDTGYCEAFKVIGQQHGPFDLSAIAIGAYAPCYFMGSQHIDPEQALLVHDDLQSKLSVGIHWGTFPMGSTEPYLEPRELLESLQASKSYQNPFITVQHGKVQIVSTENTENHTYQ